MVCFDAGDDRRGVEHVADDHDADACARLLSAASPGRVVALSVATGEAGQ
jgi:hypothetical protein